MKVVLLTDDPEERMCFKCPGCMRIHKIPTKGPAAWGFNGNMDSPTFTPSILATWDFGPDTPKKICHSFVNNGRIQFLGDCTHDLAGRTVDLNEVE